MPQESAVDKSLIERRLGTERKTSTGSASKAGVRAERLLRELSVLAAILKSAAALVDERRLLGRVVDAAVYLASAEEGFLLLVDEDSGELSLRAGRGSNEKADRQFHLKVGDSLARQVVQTGKPIVVPGAKREEALRARDGYPVRSLIHVPLKVGDRVLGVLSVHHRTQDRTFNDHDLRLLSTLADSAAISLEHARMCDRLRTQPPSQQTAPSAAPATEQEAPANSERLQGVLEGLEAYRAQVRTCIESARTILADLREQAVSFENRLAEIASQETVLSAPDEGAGLLPVAELQRSLRQVLDNVEDGILVLDADDRIELANRAASVMLGQALTGQTVDSVCADPRWSKTYDIVRAAMQIEGGTPGSELTSATTVLAVDQSVLRATFRVQPALDDGPPGTVVLLEDIAAEREAERARDLFVSSISRELRTPMTSIEGYADLLASGSVGSLGDAQVKLVQRIRSGAQQIASLLNDLSDMAVSSGRQLQLRDEVVDLTAVIHEACGAMRYQMAEKDQVLELNLDPNLPVVQADADALFHVLTILFQNAHCCSPRGARIVLRAIKMRGQQGNGGDLYVAVSVADRGGGIALEDHRRVFERASRAADPAVPGLGDPGVHLPMLRVLVEAIGGRVWLDGTPGVGSTFTCLLPVRRPVSRAAGISRHLELT